MSSGTNFDAATLIALFNSLYIGGYCGVAASVLFIYDAFVTFDREVASFWAAKWTAASVLFFANKWLSLTYFVMVLIDFATFPSDKRLVHRHMQRHCAILKCPTTLHSCGLFNLASLAISALQFIPWAVFSGLRAYVLSRSKLLGSLVFALSMAQVGANLVPYGYQPIGENFPPFGCLGTDNTTETLNLCCYIAYSSEAYIVTVIARAPLILADVLLVYITWVKLSSRDALREIRPFSRLSLSDVLLRDGTVYFVILFILNTLHLVLSITAVASDGTESYVTIFTSPITAILVSHFLLELQEANRTVIRVGGDDPLHSSRDPYDDEPSFFSSIGGFITPGSPSSHDDGSELYDDSGIGWEGDDELHIPQVDAPSSSAASGHLSPAPP